MSRCGGTRARAPGHARRPPPDPEGERAGRHHRRRGRFGRRLSHQTRPGKEPLLRHDRTGGPVRRGLDRLYPGKPRSLIRRGLLAAGAGVPLLVLVAILALVFRDDVVFTVRTVQDPQFPRALLNQSWKDIIATAVDSSHVRFALPGHNAGFLANLELLDIVPSHLLAGKSIAELASASPNLNPVGTRPFRMVANLADRIQL